MKLTHRSLQLRDSEHNTIHHHNRRVRVYTPSGTQIGLPGIGKSLVDLTFPGSWKIRSALFFQDDQYRTDWIRFATGKEQEEDKNNPNAKWWRMSELQPKAFLDEGHCIASLDDSMDQRGFILTAIATAPVVQWEESLRMPTTPNSTAEISAPTTPSSIDDISQPRKRKRLLENSAEETPRKKRCSGDKT